MLPWMMTLEIGVGQFAFQAVADLDADFALVGGDDEDGAVVALRLAYAPGAAQRDAVFLDGLAV
jgi:hypothetical protein